MHGERDAMAPISNARLLAERIPDAELAIVPGSGHAFLLERPEASFELLTDWLDRRSPIAAGEPRRGRRRARRAAHARVRAADRRRPHGREPGRIHDRQAVHEECPCGV